MRLKATGKSSAIDARFRDQVAANIERGSHACHQHFAKARLNAPIAIAIDRANRTNTQGSTDVGRGAIEHLHQCNACIGTRTCLIRKQAEVAANKKIAHGACAKVSV